MPRRVAAGVCLAAGVFVLLGFGWALLAAGVLLLVGVPAGSDESVAAVAGRVRTWAATAVLQVRTVPRRSVAVGCMSVGVAAVPAGVLLATGVGVALVTFGGLMLGVSVLSGWNA